MPVVLARVDDRLIHGQVAVGWARAVSADLLVVANDPAASDTLQQSLFALAAPAGIRVRVLPVAGAARAEASGEFESARAILLFATPSDAAAFSRCGGRIRCLNVGGMRSGPGKRTVREGVCMDAADESALRELASRGVELECRVVPTDRAFDLQSAIGGGSA